MAKDKNFKKMAGDGEKQTNKAGARNTHFLCFPISSKETVECMAESRDYFAQTTTEPRSEAPDRGLRQDENSGFAVESQSMQSNDTPDNCPLQNLAQPTPPAFADSLRILPSIVIRSPGTYHLTIGVMDLSVEAKMQKAHDLLQSLDLEKMLKDAECGPPPGSNTAKKWVGKHASKNTGVVEDDTSAAVKTASGDGQAPSTSGHGLQSLERSVSPPSPSKRRHDAVAKKQCEPRAKDVEATPPGTKPLYISLTGLGAFASAKKARVLWARPHEQIPSTSKSDESTLIDTTTHPDRLYNFALHIEQAFKNAGFFKDTRPLTLHATIVNMRYKTQGKKGRTSKGKAWTHGRKRWEDGQIDARRIMRVFNDFGGDVDAAEAVMGMDGNAEIVNEEGRQSDKHEEAEEEDKEQDSKAKVDDWDLQQHGRGKEFIWGRDLKIDRVAICKMGATKIEDPLWREWYPPVSEKLIFEQCVRAVSLAPDIASYSKYRQAMTRIDTEIGFS